MRSFKAVIFRILNSDNIEFSITSINHSIYVKKEFDFITCTVSNKFTYNVTIHSLKAIERNADRNKDK